MNSIVNTFYNLDNSIKNNNKKKRNISSEYTNNLISTPALNQGNNFNSYQNKIKQKMKKNINNVNSKEGFQNFNNKKNTTNTTNDIAKQSNQVLSETRTGKDNSLKAQYNVILKLYQTKLAEVSSGTTDFLDRLNPQKNPYLNTNIRFTTGHVCYVTNQGVVKWIPSDEILDSLRNSPGKTYTDVNIPWLTEYNTSGTTIPTTPSLISGTNMVLGETCGNEGLNVYVDKLITNSTANYNGCYANNSTTFIGGAPPPVSEDIVITNGNFAQPQIANNTYKYLHWDSTTVPGWIFYCSLINNSSAWDYPMPYPNGSQCVSIQNTQYVFTTKYFSISPGATYTISFDACGRPGYSGVNTINVGLEWGTFYSFTPPTNKWTKYSTTFISDTKQGQRISFRGTNENGDKSTAIQNIVVTKGSSNNISGGTYTYDMCKQAAIDGGYKYFGLQNVNIGTSTGYCAVSNDGVGVVQKGTAYAVSGGVALWDSKTNNSSGNIATLTNQGALSVHNSAGTAIYNTDNSAAQPSGYLGCYTDTPARAFRYYQGRMDYDACKKKATDNGAAPYFGVQDSYSGVGECYLASNINGIRDFGKAGNCKKLDNGNYVGGGYSNAIYSLDPSSIYYLILQDDGNMCIYRGSGPEDNQGGIWCSGTNGKQQKSNPNYTASKGKYGYNYIGSGTALSAGDFIGSNDGSIYLIMQSDGNLVLYTSKDSENCQKMKDGNTGGGEGANALYELSEIGIPANLGKIGYVDSNSLLSTYPDSSIEKNANGKPTLKNLPVGVSNKMVNIDSLAFEHYPKTDKMSSSYGLANANSTQKQELEQLKTRLDQISQQLADDTGSLNSDELKVVNQSNLQTNSIDNYLKEYKNTNTKIKNSTLNITGIVHDSDINVLKENYNYLFWSILAVGTVLVSMNIVKK